jgi:phosphoglycolate phosphatase-like HAD superfamily hydrolase
MPSVGVTWGFRDRAELLASGAGRIVEQPGEIAEWMGL